jgi:hypothetical protein
VAVNVAVSVAVSVAVNVSVNVSVNVAVSVAVNVDMSVSETVRAIACHQYIRIVFNLYHSNNLITCCSQTLFDWTAIPAIFLSAVITLTFVIGRQLEGNFRGEGFILGGILVSQSPPSCIHHPYSLLFTPP